MKHGKGKVESCKTGNFAKGGSTKMFGKGGAAPAIAGTTARPSQKFDKAAPKGGSTGVMGKQRGAAPAVSGAISVGGRGGDNTYKASGGKGHMAGFTPASPAKPA